MSTSQNIIDYALKLLAQPENSIVAGLPTGTAEGLWAVTSTDQMLFWLTEAQNRLARLCMPIFDYAEIQAPSAGATTLPYTTITSPSSRTMHQAIAVWITGGQQPLSPANMGWLLNNSFYPPDLQGNPSAWANNNTAIALSSYTSQPHFTITGYFLPAPLASLDQTLDTFIDDYAQRALAFYLAWMIAISNQDNTVLFERAVPLLQEFARNIKEIYVRLTANDSSISAYFPGQDIDSQVALLSQKVLKT